MDAKIPHELQDVAAAALLWFNRRQGDGNNGQVGQFEITAIVDFEHALNANPEEMLEFGLVLCDGEICDKAQFRCLPDAGGWNFSLIDNHSGGVPPLLDPPVGLRENWLDQVMAKHEFVVLLFYRGLW